MSTPTWTTHFIGTTPPCALLPPDCEGHRGTFGTRTMEGSWCGMASDGASGV